MSVCTCAYTCTSKQAIAPFISLHLTPDEHSMEHKQSKETLELWQLSSFSILHIPKLLCIVFNLVLKNLNFHL